MLDRPRLGPLHEVSKVGLRISPRLDEINKALLACLKSGSRKRPAGWGSRLRELAAPVVLLFSLGHQPVAHLLVSFRLPDDRREYSGDCQGHAALSLEQHGR
jgi:hypothetical protein